MDRGWTGTHWFMHVGDNRFDRVLRRIPMLGTLRVEQIRHHRLHHEAPDRNFAFTPLYLGDRVFGTLERTDVRRVKR